MENKIVEALGAPEKESAVPFLVGALILLVTQAVSRRMARMFFNGTPCRGFCVALQGGPWAARGSFFRPLVMSPVA